MATRTEVIHAHRLRPVLSPTAMRTGANQGIAWI